ncbi:3-hydroxybutyryl-CoA dehydrogenase [Austwickia chelonae]|uniref:Putative 3-hydroxyacyl-CoA dehydrogenase n=1 Tax=Austwickia chelonae NBRC 105200 TaxID=1184607 RepID=K6VIX8_9MICO|nr:3-hydroxybutyryl-CoA dehydrogenase [Austwickia chelonae]GAB76689.1 putative 3-hydroxyacyl-CoA dehydrogenase [Austwickia chelonae NBRC 105200]SEW29308.1 3-hydroxybutyryl-CoA dehydrogenase [Austwickia chelonae]
MTRQINTIGVIGLGTMGAGIAEVFARHGLTVHAVEIDDDAAHDGHRRLADSTSRAVAGDKMTAGEREQILDRITVGTDPAAVADCDLVIEAVTEDIERKRIVFAQLDAVVREDTILATNTSALSVTDIAVSTAHPNRVVGMHFFNPAPVQGLVEVVGTVATDETILDEAKTLVERIGKEPVVVGDRAGFIANALLLGYLNHAMSMYENRYASREDIDAAMQLGCGYPMGPLALADLIGLDVCYAVLDTMYRQGRDRLHAPAPLLKQMVAAGRLGRKSGRGFYTYQRAGSGTVVPDRETPGTIPPDGTPEPRPIRTVGVVGNGTMATGIVEVFAKAGYPVVLVARTQEKADRAVAGLAKSLDRAVTRGRLGQQDRDAALARVTGTDRLEELAQVDIVVEAVVEDLQVKQEIFRRLDRICRPGCVLATTTSSLPVIQVAVATSRPGDVVGMHFFNPAQVMKLVEVVSTVTTADDIRQTVHELCGRLGKHAVHCGDRAGFIVNALLFPYLNDAVKLLEAHYASADDIDRAMIAGCGLPMGPFELLDVVGLDVSYAIQRELYLEFRERGFAPAPLLEHLTKGGYLGRKTGRGFRIHAA